MDSVCVQVVQEEGESQVMQNQNIGPIVKPVAAVGRLALVVALSAAAVGCGTEPAGPRFMGGYHGQAGMAPLTPVPYGCSPDVSDAIRRHVTSSSSCFAGEVYSDGSRLRATSREPSVGVLVCSGETLRPWDLAQRAAESALAELPVPTGCELGSLSFGAGLAAEQNSLAGIVSTCRSALGTTGLSSCGVGKRILLVRKLKIPLLPSPDRP